MGLSFSGFIRFWGWGVCKFLSIFKAIPLLPLFSNYFQLWGWRAMEKGSENNK